MRIFNVVEGWVVVNVQVSVSTHRTKVGYFKGTSQTKADHNPGGVHPAASVVSH